MTALHSALSRILQGYVLEEVAVSLPDGDPQELVLDGGELWQEQAQGERLVVVLHLVRANADEAA